MNKNKNINDEKYAKAKEIYHFDNDFSLITSIGYADSERAMNEKLIEIERLREYPEAENQIPF